MFRVLKKIPSRDTVHFIRKFTVGVNVILPFLKRHKDKAIILTYNSEVDQGVSSRSRFEVHSTPVDPLFMLLHKQVSGFSPH
jgi:hypothetical protein